MGMRDKKKEQEQQKPTAADYAILHRPIITEKSSVVSGLANCVVFEVAYEAKKPQIKDAVERIYKVNVTAVRTIQGVGKVKRRGSQVGRTRAVKKAYVGLAQGQTIDLVEGL